MKQRLIAALMCAACVTSFAQLSVNSDGQVAIGAIQDSSFVAKGGCLTIEAASTNIKRSFAAAKGAELKILKRTKN